MKQSEEDTDMADREPKGKGMPWLTPTIVLKDVKNSMAFYEEAFGFKTRFTMPDKSGKIMHAEMAYKDQSIMMGPEYPDHNMHSVSKLNGSPVGFYLYTENVDEFCKKAKAAGANVIQEPTDQFWGDRTCTVTCPEGYRWSFAQNVADFDPSKSPFDVET